MSEERSSGESSYHGGRGGRIGFSRGRGRKHANVTPTTSSQMTKREEKVANHPKESKMEHRQLNLDMSDVQPGCSEHSTWVNELVYTWIQGNDINYRITKLLGKYFSWSNNPHRTALYLMCESPDFHSVKGNNLAVSIMKIFQKWLEENNPVIKISTHLQMDVLRNLQSQNNTNLIQTVFEIYHMNDDPVIFVDEVKAMIGEKRYKQASVFAKLLNIQNYFDINEILVPLILQDKVNFVQSFLENSPEQQEKFVQFIDSMCTYESKIYHLVKTLEIPHARPEKCHPKAFKKLGTRLMKLYNIPSEKCPNILQINNTGAMKYLLYKKYTEGNIGEENWDEMVESAVQNSPQLQSELVTLLHCYNDLPCAVKFAQKFKIPTSDLPASVQRALDEYEPNNEQTVVVSREENWDEEENIFYPFPLPLSAIIFIDDKDKLMSMLRTIEISGIVGVDGEWKPTFGLEKEKLAILQIATWDMVFIVDVLALLPQMLPKDWQLFVATIFCNQSLTKLGFGIQSDIKMINRTLPNCESLLSRSVEVLDLSVLMEKLVMLHPTVFPYGCGESGKGLTDLAKMCFGKTLDKREQFSNWERRPLRETQIIYAALDAYCLLEIFKILTEKATGLGIDLEPLIKKITSPKQNKSSKKNNSSKMNQSSTVVLQSKNASKQPNECCSTHSDPQRSPADFSVVVDTMLQGLGRQLRLLGVDVRILETSENHEGALRIALSENRVILTSGQPFQKLCQYMSPGMCYNVNVTIPVREQAAEVLNAFNIRITSSDIFSRCQKCNNNRYIKVPSSTVKTLWTDNMSCVMNNSDSEDDLSSKTFVQAFDGGTIDTENLVTDQGAHLQFDGITAPLFSRVELFYICATCGKIYWEGSHLKRVVETLGNIVLSDEDVTGLN